MRTFFPEIPLGVAVAFMAGALIGTMLQIAIKDCAEDDPALAHLIQASLAVVLVAILGVAVIAYFLYSRRRGGARKSVSSNEWDISEGQQ